VRSSLAVPVVAVALAACAPPEAPENLDDLTRFMFAEWDADDARVRAAGLANLQGFLATSVGPEGAKGSITAETPSGDRSWSVSDLVEDDVEGLTRPDRPLDKMVGVSVAHVSRWPVDDHARWQAEADQLPAEPSAVRYDRTFPEPDDRDCFPAEACDVMETVNDARRANFLFSADFVLLKDFRWVPYTDLDGVDRRAFYSRSWFEESWPGDGGSATLWQSFSVDVFLDRGDGTTWRYQTSWSETEVLGGSDDIIRGTVTNAIVTAMVAGDDAIGERFHGEAAE
jgi:hypothetical protein